MPSPTQRTLARLKELGFTAGVVEKWNPHARIRQDLFGFVDIIAISDTETIAVQSTSWGHVTDRVNKIAESPLVGFVRQAGWRILVHGWRKNAKTNRYELKEIDIS